MSAFRQLRKLKDVVLSLWKHPSHFPRFVWHNILFCRSPLELGLPWWSYLAIDHFHSILGQGKRVFEWGCGGSTVFAATHGATIVTVEDSLQWMQKCQDRCKALDLKTVIWKYRKLSTLDSNSLELDAYVQAMDSSRYDIVIVDGNSRPFSNRERCFLQAEKMIMPGGLIILDDSWRYRELLSQCKAHKIDIFASTGPARNDVSETAFCWY